VLNGGNWNVVGTLGSPIKQYPITAGSLAPASPRGIFAAISNLTTPVGGKVRIHGAKVPGYNGLKTVTQFTAPNLFTFGGAAPPVADNSGNAYATAIATYDSLITNVSVSGATRRGAGRPFGLSRGRRATLYSLRP
jgi:hypothetical protein